MREAGKSRNLNEQAFLRLLWTEVGTELFQSRRGPCMITKVLEAAEHPVVLQLLNLSH